MSKAGRSRIQVVLAAPARDVEGNNLPLSAGNHLPHQARGRVTDVNGDGQSGICPDSAQQLAQGPVRIQKASFALPDRCATPAPGGEQDWLAQATAHFCGEVVLSAGTARGLTDERDGVPLILSGVLPGRSGNPHVAALPSDPPFLIGQGGVLDRGDQRPVLAYRAVLQPGPAEADRFE